MNPIWRIIDANLNRCREGLRVLEDISRFITNDRKTTSALKRYRHELNQIFLSCKIPSGDILKLRDSRRDIGRKGSICDQKKMKWQSLFNSNFKRVEESLRVLEECFKIEIPRLVCRFQALRFKVYELEKRAVALL